MKSPSTTDFIVPVDGRDMPLTDDDVLDALRRFNARQIQLAGQRYTPGVEPGAPNLKVAPLLTAVESVGCGAAAKDRFVRFAAELTEAWSRAKRSCEKRDDIQVRINAVGAMVAAILPRMCARDTAALDEWRTHLGGIVAELEGERQRWHAEDGKVAARESQEKGRERREYPSERDAIQSHINSISRCIGVLNDEQEFIASPSGRALVDPYLLISGSWGTGKTHLLCDITRLRVEGGQPTLLVLAKSFQGGRDLLSMISGEVLAGMTHQELVDHLQQVGVSRAERALIIVDGVNEGRRPEWRRTIGALALLVRDRTHVGLIVSCRTPFERVAIAQSDLARFHEVAHRGFEDQEFDAQAAFFQHYKLPLPEVPLLDAEFSRPLTLKLICQSLKDLTGRKLLQGFSGIASGQKGMTFVLESFVTRVGEAIEKEFGLSTKACWWLLKGTPRITDRRYAGFAPSMAATLREYVLPRAAHRILAAHFPTLKPKRRRELLEALRTSGLIDEDAVWYPVGDDVKSRVVFRLPYQRFSDHLIARHLLEAYLQSSTEASVKRSFARGMPLGRVFRRGRYSETYARAGWAQALITEFPERVKKRVPSRRRELLFFLPSSAQHLSRYFEPFVEGLFWRDPSAFTEGTRRVINACLNLNRSDAWNRVVDALVAISTKPKHPFHAWRLYQFIERFRMHERDLRWSEYLRRRYSSPSIQRLLAWAERLTCAEMDEGTARELVVLFSLVLTTVARRDRDVASKALVVIGEQYPRVLFEHVVATLDFNDPYVPERMLAAAYGVTMSRVDDRAAPTFHGQLAWLAWQLYRKMFTPHAPHRTHHVLRRDYALGIIRLAQRARCVTLATAARRYLSLPFGQIPSPFPDIATVSDEIHDTGEFAIRMDFGNYTIGHLIPDRANYDNANLDYLRIRTQIEWRIHDLGLRRKDFDDIDSEIGRAAPYDRPDGHHVDRYGKKYSWIAYFEMYGVCESKGALPEWRLGERTPECDIDPSFPKRPPPWAPPLPDVFGGSYQGLADWLANGPSPDLRRLLRRDDIAGLLGPWVLLEGHMDEKDPAHGWQLWTLLRGLFLRGADVPRLRKRYFATDYPGNNRIPRSGEDHYVFGGEIGRSLVYAPNLARTDGSYRRQMASAFEEHRWIPDASERPRSEAPERPAVVTNEEGGVTLNFPALRKARQRGRHHHIPGIRVELPTRAFGWESYHSALNDFSGFFVPAPSLIQKLKLHTRNREIDFYDSTGAQATLYRESNPNNKARRVTLLYIRESLVKKYLRATRQTLVWCSWGERNFLRGNSVWGMDGPPDASLVLQNRGHIHRSFATFEEVCRAPVG